MIYQKRTGSREEEGWEEEGTPNFVGGTLGGDEFHSRLLLLFRSRLGRFLPSHMTIETSRNAFLMPFSVRELEVDHSFACRSRRSSRSV